MKLVEQYLKAIGMKLSWKNREDIKAELRSSLMDEIEARYGADPSEEDLKEAIESFGSPSEVAERYRGTRHVISPKFLDLYYLILPIVLGALAVAFITVFMVQWLSGQIEGAGILRELLRLPLTWASASLSAIGSVTLVFMALSRLFAKKGFEEASDWSVKDLAGISIEEDAESRVEAIIGVCFAVLLILLLNLYPQIVTIAEESFLKSGLTLGHQLVIPRFRGYVAVLSVLWAASAGLNLTVLKTGVKSGFVRIGDLVLDGLTIAMMAIMLLDSRLYVYENGWIGFKVIFSILLVVCLAELASGIFKALRRKMTGESRSLYRGN